MTTQYDIPLSPSSQPIFDFIAAYNAVIAAEYGRLSLLPRYDPLLGESHQEWMRLHEEEMQTILRLGALGAEAIRAGALAGEAATTGRLVRRVMDAVRGLHGWVGRWWDQYGERYHAWRERHWPSNPEGIVKSPGKCAEMPPEYIDAGLPFLRPTSETLCDLTNRLHVIAIAVPLPPPPSGENKTTAQDPARNEYMSPTDLASRYGLNKTSLEARLRRWRDGNPAESGKGWIETQDGGPRQPRYLYRVRTVLFIVNALQASRERRAKK